MSRGHLVRTLLVGTALLVVAMVGLTGGASTDSTADATVTAVWPAAQLSEGPCEAEVAYGPSDHDLTAPTTGRAASECDVAVGSAVRVRYRSAEPHVAYVSEPPRFAWALLATGSLTLCAAVLVLVTRESPASALHRGGPGRP